MLSLDPSTDNRLALALREDSLVPAASWLREWACLTPEIHPQLRDRLCSFADAIEEFATGDDGDDPDSFGRVTADMLDELGAVAWPDSADPDERVSWGELIKLLGRLTEVMGEERGAWQDMLGVLKTGVWLSSETVAELERLREWAECQGDENPYTKGFEAGREAGLAEAGSGTKHAIPDGWARKAESFGVFFEREDGRGRVVPLGIAADTKWVAYIKRPHDSRWSPLVTGKKTMTKKFPNYSRAMAAVRSELLDLDEDERTA